jgi:hypothetical protein
MAAHVYHQVVIMFVLGHVCIVRLARYDWGDSIQLMDGPLSNSKQLYTLTKVKIEVKLYSTVVLNYNIVGINLNWGRIQVCWTNASCSWTGAKHVWETWTGACLESTGAWSGGEKPERSLNRYKDWFQLVHARKIWRKYIDYISN